MTGRERVIRTLEFRNKGFGIPKHLWYLPWASDHYPNELEDIISSFDWDITGVGAPLATPTKTEGDAYSIGRYVDEWGCVFHNIQRGVIGEVKEPLVQDEDWDDVGNIHIPVELLTFDIDEVNRRCEKTDKFTQAGCCPRPFERMQFIRGSEDLYVDLITQPPKMLDFMRQMHEFECELVDKWCRTDVDSIMFMDDWGSQNTLLINPTLWEELFMPRYRDFIAIAKSYGKKTFMHSDGNTISIIPKLIDIGLDAFNTQIFCIGVENLAPFKGKLTFWGEIDRQHLIPNGTLEDIDHAVDSVYDTVWADGGCIAQCEFGPMGNPANVKRIYERWGMKNI